MVIDDLQNQYWDVIIIGAGMGGATLGYKLARRGKKVLFCEEGLSLSKITIRGCYPEITPGFSGGIESEKTNVLRLGGRSALEIEDHSYSRPRKFTPFIGSAVGGSTGLYGMALERLFPSDFAPRANFPNRSIRRYRRIGRSPTSNSDPIMKRQNNFLGFEERPIQLENSLILNHIWSLPL